MIEKLKAKFTKNLPEIPNPKKNKEEEVGEIVSREIREGREWLTVRYESGDVSGFTDDVFRIMKGGN